MDEQNINVSDMYKKYYEMYEKESICLNMKKFESERNFHFLSKGYRFILNETSFGLLLKNFKTLIFSGYWSKTENCYIIIDYRYEYFGFKFIIKELEKGIKKWEKRYYETIFDHLSLEYQIEKKAIVDVLKKEISFMKNRLIFKKWWFFK